MTSERAHQVERIYHAALAAQGSAREALLDAMCAGDEALRHEVLSLLSYEGDARSFLSGRPFDLVAETVTAATRLDRPVVIGPYKVLDVLGEGGMGIVYLAEQDRPLHRRVALKVIKVGMETREVIARFEAERQALALMDHPCIANVYDAGATPDGKPYFAMEYVAGVPITHYCDTHRLDMDARLDLFVHVCGAIQHAHQKGIIHRDIKPSNLLVTLKESKPLPKIIDFGVAKATHQRLTEKTMFTQLGMLIGTPAYMSPEQAEMSGLSVDTTTDIYSLGVVLYELMTGALPFDPELLRDAGYAEIRRIIREQEPLRPSARLISLHASATDVALRRGLPLPKLVRELRGDLDWIALKAMDKDRTRRYPSASELAADVTRHLQTEPVKARPASLTYRAKKFVRKYRVALIPVALGVTASTVLSTAVLTQRTVAATAQGVIAQTELVKDVVFHSLVSAAARNRDAPWASAIVDDDGLRRTLEAVVVTFRAQIMTVAICDADGRVVMSSDRRVKECPSGRPLSELASVNVLAVLDRIRPETGDYVLSYPFTDNRERGGVLRIRVSRLGTHSELVLALRRAAFWCVVQILAVPVLASISFWVAFRREH